jgi:hypothetical protein
MFGRVAIVAAIAMGMAVLASQSASAAVRIANDAGGQIGPYLDRLATLRSSGETVVIDGPCLSACTLLLGVIPHERICVTSRAKLGFHAAWKPDAYGHKRFSPEGTRALWDKYPANVRAWLTRRGGLKTNMVYLRGSELAAMYQTCPPQSASAVTTR